MYPRLAELFHRHPVVKTMHTFRHRPYIRNIIYSGIIFLGLYALYYTVGAHNYHSGDRAFPSIPVKTDPASIPAKVWRERSDNVKRAFLHAYHGWERYAAPNDELKPLSKGFKNPCVHSFIRRMTEYISMS